METDSEKDIEYIGKCLDRFQKTSYEEMVFMFWKPIKSFYKDANFPEEVKI